MVWVHPDIDDQIDVIREGRGEMPPFDRVLSDEELRAVAEHERSL
jgi:mono/diheme cytochrome c family protein